MSVKIEESLRGDTGFGVLLNQLPFGIDGEDSVQRNTHLLIGIHILKPHNSNHQHHQEVEMDPGRSY